MLAHKLTSVAWWEGAVGDESLIAVPASAASRKHPGNCLPYAQSSWSHEPEFSVQFISQPFWSTPCLLRTTNPIGTRCPGLSGKKGTSSSISANLDICLYSLPLFLLGESSEEAIFFPFSAFFLFFIFFFPFLTSCLWCRSQVFCGCLGSVASSLAEDDGSWWKGGRKRQAWRSSVYTLLYIWKGQSSLCDPEHICPLIARYFLFSSSESFSF